VLSLSLSLVLPISTHHIAALIQGNVLMTPVAPDADEDINPLLKYLLAAVNITGGLVFGYNAGRLICSEV
jgi:hypothetical protein